MLPWPIKNSCLSHNTNNTNINKREAPKKCANKKRNFKTPVKESSASNASKSLMLDFVGMSSKTDTGVKASSGSEGGLSDESSDNEGNTTIKEISAASTPKDTGYRQRLRNQSYQQSVSTPLAATPLAATSTDNKATKKGTSQSTSEDCLGDEMGSIEDLLPPKFLLKKEEFEKKNNTTKFEAVFDSVNKLYNLHAQVLSRTKALEFAVFDEEDGILPQLHGLASNAQDSSEKQSLMTRELIDLREELDIAKGLIHKQSKQIKELKSKQTDLIARSMADNITITGIKGDENKADTRSQVHAFLEEELELEIDDFDQIPVVHRLGAPTKGFHRPVVLKCPPKLRKEIFENVTKLAGKNFSINQQYPEAIAEQRREIRHAIKSVKNTEEGKEDQDKSTFLIRGGRLFVNGQMVRKKLVPPAPENLFVNASEKK